MKKIIEKTFCDLCKAEAVTTAINYPVVFHTEQTEGRGVDPYITQTTLDVCKNCADKILKIHAMGAQGYNQYTVAEEGMK